MMPKKPVMNSSGTAVQKWRTVPSATSPLSDSAAIVARYGIQPAQWADYRALVGDPSDNLPGVRGIGPRTAASLVTRFGTVDALLGRVAEVEPARLREALERSRDELPLYVQLTRLRSDVPLPPGPRFGRVAPGGPDRMRRFFEELEFRSLLPKLDEALVAQTSPAQE